MSTEASDPAEFIALASEIVSAYVSRNSVPVAELPGVISAVHAALAGLANSQGEKKPAEAPIPAISIRKSITPDHLISLEDGKRYKSLKRHLAGRGLTPDQYRAKWGLPGDYPMVAPNYAKARSELAKASGLGAQRRKSAQAKAAAPDPVVTDEAPAKAKRGRKPKAA